MTDRTFALRPDLILETSEKQIIADTKYKMVYNDPGDPKNGISQTDLYQVLSYAVRYKIEDVVLLYPDTIKNYQNEATGFTIRDEFADQVDVKITACQLPIINRALINGAGGIGMKLDDVFEDLKDDLIDRLKAIMESGTMAPEMV